MARGHVGQEPERVMKVRKEPYIGVREWRSGACLQVCMGLRHVSAANNVQPLLNLVLMSKLGVRAAPFRSEKLIEIKLIELTAVCDVHQLLWHLIGQQAHLRQCSVRVPFAWMSHIELSLNSLLIAVGPVEYLFLDELPGSKRPERRAGEIEVRVCGDGQEIGIGLGEKFEVFVNRLEGGCIFQLAFLSRDGFILALK